MRHSLLVLVVVLVAAACGGSSTSTTSTALRPLGTSSPVTTSPIRDAPPTTSPVTTSPVTTSPVTTSPIGSDQDPDIPQPIVDGGFGFATVTIGDRELNPVAIADTPSRRSQGLMFVTDMGDVAGMLFVYRTMRSGSFWMKNTLIPLDIAFFDAAGRLVDKLEMQPCPDLGDTCPMYMPSGRYQYAFEAPLGDLAWLDGDDRLLPP